MCKLRNPEKDQSLSRKVCLKTDKSRAKMSIIYIEEL